MDFARLRWNWWITFDVTSKDLAKWWTVVCARSKVYLISFVILSFWTQINVNTLQVVYIYSVWRGKMNVLCCQYRTPHATHNCTGHFCVLSMVEDIRLFPFFSHCRLFSAYKQYARAKHCYPSIRLHDVMTQTITVWMPFCGIKHQALFVSACSSKCPSRIEGILTCHNRGQAEWRLLWYVNIL